MKKLFMLFAVIGLLGGCGGDESDPVDPVDPNPGTEQPEKPGRRILFLFLFFSVRTARKRGFDLYRHSRYEFQGPDQQF